MSPTTRPTKYRVTFMDRMGAEGAVRIRVFQYGLMAFGASVAIFIPAAVLLPDGVPPAWRVAWVVSCVASSTAISSLLALLMSDGAGTAYQMLMMDGSSTPYEQQFSHEQALVMQGRVPDALLLFEDHIRADPHAVAPRLRAAELYAREVANPQRAAELFREVQHIPDVDAGSDVQASMRLVDLLLGPLAEPGRALVELRRLVDRHPASPVADHARIAIAKIKADLGVTPPDGSSYSS